MRLTRRPTGWSKKWPRWHELLHRKQKLTKCLGSCWFPWLWLWCKGFLWRWWWWTSRLNWVCSSWQFKSFRTSVVGKSPMWPSAVFSTFICNLCVWEMCFSKYNSPLQVLSQRLHWTSQLLFVMWTFNLSALLKAAGQFSHLNAFFSPTHFIMWEFLLL